MTKTTAQRYDLTTNTWEPVTLEVVGNPYFRGLVPYDASVITSSTWTPAKRGQFRLEEAFDIRWEAHGGAFFALKIVAKVRMSSACSVGDSVSDAARLRAGQVHNKGMRLQNGQASVAASALKCPATALSEREDLSKGRKK